MQASNCPKEEAPNISFKMLDADIWQNTENKILLNEMGANHFDMTSLRRKILCPSRHKTWSCKIQGISRVWRLKATEILNFSTLQPNMPVKNTRVHNKLYKYSMLKQWWLIKIIFSLRLMEC